MVTADALEIHIKQREKKRQHLHPKGPESNSSQSKPIVGTCRSIYISIKIEQ
jgi:hypothetical protein